MCNSTICYGGCSKFLSAVVDDDGCGIRGKNCQMSWVQSLALSWLALWCAWMWFLLLVTHFWTSLVVWLCEVWLTYREDLFCLWKRWHTNWRKISCHRSPTTIIPEPRSYCRSTTHHVVVLPICFTTLIYMFVYCSCGSYELLW